MKTAYELMLEVQELRQQIKDNNKILSEARGKIFVLADKEKLRTNQMMDAVKQEKDLCKLPLDKVKRTKKPNL